MNNPEKLSKEEFKLKKIKLNKHKKEVEETRSKAAALF